MIVAPASCRWLEALKTKRLAKCWKITLTNGDVIRFTSASITLTLADGEDYSPVAGTSPSAHRRESALGAHDLEFSGVVNSSRISIDALKAGLYNDAEVRQYKVDWRYPWAGNIAESTFWIDYVTFDGERWNAQLRGRSRWYEPKIGDKYARDCQHTLGDSKCQVDLPSNTVSGVVVLGMLDGEKRRFIRATTGTLSGSFIDDWFNWGFVTFTSGANDGIRRDVKDYTSATRDVELMKPFPFEIAAGDQFSITAGCNGLKTTCISKFGNLDNWGGYEFMPGTDAVLRVKPR